MPPPLNIDKEAVRVLVVAVGAREAARQMGLSESTVMQWSARGKWLAHTRPEPPHLPVSMQPTAVIGVSTPADALRDALAADGNLVKTQTMRFARLATAHAASKAESDPATALEQAGNIKQVVQAAAIAGGWQSATQGVELRLAIFTGPVEPPAIDI